jgi:hypothetical protein
MGIESKIKGRVYPEASETWERTFPEGTVHFYLHPEGFEIDGVKQHPMIGFKVVKDGREIGDCAAMPDFDMGRDSVEDYFRETINKILIGGKDARVEMRPLRVNTLDGLDGNRSDCCYAPAKYGADPLNPTCSKCGKDCGLLSEEQKLGINRKAKGAIDELTIRQVLTIVIHKPTNESAYKIVPLPHVRKFAKAVVDSYGIKLSRDHGIDGMEAPVDEFVIVEVEEGEVRVSRLEV